MPEIDLNASKRARAEKLGELPVVTYGEPPQRFELVPELPVDWIDHYSGGDFRAGIRCAFPSEEEAQRFFALKPTIPDCVALYQWITETYLGTDPGESTASDSSSKRSSGSSRPRSKRATG